MYRDDDRWTPPSYSDNQYDPRAYGHEADAPSRIDPPRKRNYLPLIAIIMVLVLGGGMVTAGVLMAKGVGPFKDSGVAACEEIAKKKNVATAKEANFTPEEYKKLREVFADSRHEDIQKAGTHFVDTFWQVWQISDNGNKPEQAFTYLGQLQESMTALVGACASHGVVVEMKLD